MMKPKLIIVRGPPGSGKSTISRILGEKLGEKSIVFNKDSFLIGINFVKIDSRENQREIVNLIISKFLDKGYNVIMDGIFGGKEGAKKLDKTRELALKHKAKFFVVSLNCSLKTSFSRVVSRKGHIVQKKFPKKEVIYWYNYFYQTNLDYGINIDTEKMNLNETVKEIIRKIKE